MLTHFKNGLGDHCHSCMLTHLIKIPFIGLVSYSCMLTHLAGNNCSQLL